MTKRKNITIYSTLIFLILILMALFGLQKNNVNSAKAQEPTKKELITTSNRIYYFLSAYQSQVQGQHLIYSSMEIIYLFDENDFSIFGLQIYIRHEEIWDSDHQYISPTEPVNVVFSELGGSDLYITNENNNPYISIDYILTQYQNSNYLIPTFDIFWGNDSFEDGGTIASTIDNGAFNAFNAFYGDYVSIPNSFFEGTFSLMYPLMDDTYDQGYNVGFDKGYNEGNISGYNEGYTAGQKNAYSPSWMESLFSSLDKIFQVEIFPNFKLWYLIGAPLMVALIVAVLKFLR